MERLTLIGTVHLDPDGHQRLLAALRKVKPELVTVEVSQYALEYRRSIGPELLKRLDPFRLADGSLPVGMHAIAAQLALPFEWTAAEEFADRFGARVVAVGDGTLSRQLLDRLEKELMPTDNLVTLATREEPPLAEQVAQAWRRARRDAECGPALDSRAASRLATLDKRMARQIKRYAENVPTVHVGGWEHLTGLAEALARFEPEVRLLID